MRPFWLALQFLTRLPTPQLDGVGDREVGLSLLFYPLVGLIIGGLLYFAAQLLTFVSPPFSAAIIVTLWLWLTGALHVDGLADMADAWVGGHGDRERTLAIMKDPYCGPMGVSAVVALLLLKFATLSELTGNGALLLIVPVVGRSFVLLLMLTTPYVCQQGLASDMVGQMPRRAAWSILLVVAVMLTWWLHGIVLWLLAASLVVFLLYRRALMKRLQGFTGDAAGALIEIIELVVLLTTVIIISA